MAKELQQLAPLPTELDPELQFGSEGIPQGVLDRAQEESSDFVAARNYLAEHGLISTGFNPLERAIRVLPWASCLLGAASFVTAIVSLVLGSEALLLGAPAGVVLMGVSAASEGYEHTPKIVRMLGAHITHARREKLRSWASAHYGKGFDEHLLSALQSELAGRSQSILAQLQSRPPLAQPEGSVPKILQRIVAESP